MTERQTEYQITTTPIDHAKHELGTATNLANRRVDYQESAQTCALLAIAWAVIALAEQGQNDKEKGK